DDLEHGGRGGWLPGGQEGRPRDRGRSASRELSLSSLYSRRKHMTTAIIGVGNIGTAVARHLVNGGERVVLAAHDESNAAALANELGELASATSVETAITGADAVVFAVWLDTLKGLIAQHADLLRGKVVVDPSNPVAQDANGEVARTLPDDQSSGSVVAGLLPAEAHFVKAF